VTAAPMTVRRTTLANGLRVVVVPQPHLHHAHVALFVRAGSRFEDSKTNGLSHLVEHTVHTGTRRFPDARALTLAIERIGGVIDAGTGEDDCVFPMYVPPKAIGEASSILAEVVRQPTFRHVKAERRRVIEEIREDEDAQDERARSLVFKRHPLGLCALGTEKRVRSFRKSELRQWHRRLFVAQNAVLVFAGAVTPRAALSFARRDFGTMRRGARLESDAPTFDRTKPRLAFAVADDDQTSLRCCFRGLDASAAVEVLGRVIGEGEVSRLYERLCDMTGLCYTAKAELCGYEDAAYMQITAVSRRPARVVREVLGILDALAREGPSVAELARVRQGIARWPLEMADSIEQTADFYGTEALYGRETSLQGHVAKLLRVSADAVRGAARELARPERLSVVASGPKREIAQVKRLVKAWRGYAQ